MAERFIDETHQKLKDSAEKRRLKARKEKIQTEIISRRKLFATNIGESDIQINEPEEVKEDPIYKKEDPGCNAHMELSKYKRRRKCCKKKMLEL